MQIDFRKVSIGIVSSLALALSSSPARAETVQSSADASSAPSVAYAPTFFDGCSKVTPCALTYPQTNPLSPVDFAVVVCEEGLKINVANKKQPVHPGSVVFQLRDTACGGKVVVDTDNKISLHGNVPPSFLKTQANYLVNATYDLCDMSGFDKGRNLTIVAGPQRGSNYTEQAALAL